MIEIGKRIRTIRLVKKMNQAELVNGHFSLTYLSRVENQRIKPSDNFIQWVSERLQVPVNLIVNANSDLCLKEIDRLIEKGMQQEFTEEELLFLQLEAQEVHEVIDYIKIYWLLLKYYLDQKHDFSKAREIVEKSKIHIPEYVDQISHASIFHYYMSCGMVCFQAQDYGKAHQYYLLCEAFIDLVDRADMAKYYHKLSQAKRFIHDDMTIALHYAEKAYEFVMELDDVMLKMDVLVHKGILHLALKQYTKAKQCLTEGLEIARKIHDQESEALIYYHLGIGCRDVQKYDKAIEYFVTSERINEKIRPGKNLADCYLSLAEAYKERKEWFTARSYLEKGILLTMEQELHVSFIEMGCLKVHVNKEMTGDWSNYEKDIKNILEYCNEKKQTGIRNKIACELADYYYERKSFRKAAEYYRMAAGKG
ncbi:helix-turn-helix transcriptional regulator [Peribacillus glennii]|uniref:XRE family transcriptional regulator n=1 Tax=Peribacillus glennii TaxID=2303991 RepID=A0A372L7T6_9BACI|nr:helix-turn-helix transcriptional regulator [Peribacillus glennii]RFU60857.1 XRE family transcriptional regulator [Peribacillus glennii]